MSDFEVVILSYNHPQITESAVLSVLNHIEASQINLVHNGTLENHRNYLRAKFPQINHVVIPENLGFSGGANRGLEAAYVKSSWCLFLTNDCELLKPGEPPSRVSLSAPTVVSKKGDKVYSMGGLFDSIRAELRHCKTEEEFLQSSKVFKKYVPGSVFWIHRDIFERASGFDESLGTYWEDVDLSLRVQERGFELGLSPATVVSHKVGKTCFGDPHYTTYLFQRNRKIVSRRNVGSRFRFLLEMNLAFSWGKQGLKNILAQDYQKIKLLLKAIS